MFHTLTDCDFFVGRQEGSGGGGYGRDNSISAHNFFIFYGDKSDVCRWNAPVCITCLVSVIFLAQVSVHKTILRRVIQCVIASYICMGRKIEHFDQ